MLIAAGLITVEYEYVHIVWMRSLCILLNSNLYTILRFTIDVNYLDINGPGYLSLRKASYPCIMQYRSKEFLQSSFIQAQVSCLIKINRL